MNGEMNWTIYSRDDTKKKIIIIIKKKKNFNGVFFFFSSSSFFFTPKLSTRCPGLDFLVSVFLSQFD